MGRAGDGRRGGWLPAATKVGVSEEERNEASLHAASFNCRPFNLLKSALG